MKKTCVLFILLLAILMAPTAQAALVYNVQKTITQPDGSTFDCLLTGDEYFRYLHDQSRYTILKDKDGWYKYAVKTKDGGIEPSSFVVGKSDPAAAGIAPKALPSTENYYQVRTTALPARPWGPGSDTETMPTTGDVNNIVIFVKFKGDPDFKYEKGVYEVALNGEAPEELSLKKYYKEVSYYKLNITSHFFPVSGGDDTGGGDGGGGGGGCFLSQASSTGQTEIANAGVFAYTDSRPRTYYQPKVGDNDGYSTDDERNERELQLIKDAFDSVAEEIAASSVAGSLDANNDTVIDSVTFIIQGEPDAGGWGNLLWQHATPMQYYHSNDKLKNLNLGYYTFNFEINQDINDVKDISDIDERFLAILCHEMFHTMGAPDLYDYTDQLKDIATHWCVMAGVSTPQPPHPLVWMKYTYGKWGGYGTVRNTNMWYYLLPTAESHPLYNAIALEPTNSTTELIMVENRQKTGLFESAVPGSGLIFYRVHPYYFGNTETGSYEIYVYRPGGGMGSPDPNISNAYYHPSVSRTAFHQNTDPKPTLSDGSLADGIIVINIQPVTDDGKDYMAFYLSSTIP